MNTWVYGKDGWYMAMNGTREAISARWKELGYEVAVSPYKPDWKPTKTA